MREEDTTPAARRDSDAFRIAVFVVTRVTVRSGGRVLVRAGLREEARAHQVRAEVGPR